MMIERKILSRSLGGKRCIYAGNAVLFAVGSTPDAIRLRFAFAS